MNNVRLDDLVVQSCASHLHIMDRIVLELVSRQFAHALLVTNAACKISLTVRVDEFVTTEGIDQQICISIASDSKCANWKTIIPSWQLPVFLSLPHRKRDRVQIEIVVSPLTNLQKIISHVILPASNPKTYFSDSEEGETAATIDNIRRILLAVFSRFKHFNRLNFLPSSTWARFAMNMALEIISVEGFQPNSVKQLIYTPGGYCDPWSALFEFSESDCCLIEMLGPFLEEVMVLDGELPQAGTDLSKRFWKAISMCSGLKKLYMCRLFYRSNVFSNMDLQDCLRSLKISEFHTCGSSRGLCTKWFFEAFRNNANLRKLSFNPVANTVTHLAMPAALEIILRLNSIELAVSSYDFNGHSKFNEMHMNVRKIFRALPENGHVKVEDKICVRRRSPEAIDVATVKALAFWIRLSDETQKAIRLYARVEPYHEGKTIVISRQAIDALHKEEEFESISIEHRINRTVLLFNNARVTLRYKLLAWKRDLPPEYVCSRGPHVD